MGAGTACTSNSLQYQSTLYERTNGVALRGTDAWGTDQAQAGMSGTTCAVDQSWAALGTDYDYPGTDEQVQDAGVLNGDDVVIITAEDKVFVQKGDDLFAGSSSTSVPGVEEVVIAGDDLVAIVSDDGACSVRWVLSGDTKELAGRGCTTDDFSISGDPATGAAVVGSDDGVLWVTPDSTEVITEQPSELSEWDAFASVLYAASIGDTVLRGHEVDGSLRFATDLGAEILGLDDMGSRAAAVVTVRYFDGAGGAILVDGYTGAILDGVDTPAAVSTVKGSPDGRTLALVDANQVHFFGPGDSYDAWDFVDPFSSFDTYSW